MSVLRAPHYLHDRVAGREVPSRQRVEEVELIFFVRTAAVRLDLLQGDDIRVEFLDHGGDAVGRAATPEAPAGMNVVAGDAQRPARFSGLPGLGNGAGCLLLSHPAHRQSSEERRVGKEWVRT